MYLFHELPEDVRKTVAAEIARVLKPGGILALSDSIQLADRPCLDAKLGMFGSMNEPYHENYIRTNLGKYISCIVWSFKRPNEFVLGQ